MTERDAAKDAVIEAARRASESMNLLINRLCDPGIEALVAHYTLRKALARYDAAIFHEGETAVQWPAPPPAPRDGGEKTT